MKYRDSYDDEDEIESLIESLRKYQKGLHEFMRTFENRVNDLITEGFDPMQASIIAVNENNEKVRKKLNDGNNKKHDL